MDRSFCRLSSPARLRTPHSGVCYPAGTIRIATDMPTKIRTLWSRLEPLPGGRRLFGFALGRIAPYSGSIHPEVLELRSGYARLVMRDRRAIRNHLGSIHAVALMNLAELTSGLALNYSLPSHGRAILLGLSIEFLKKARGRLTAEASAPVPHAVEREEVELTTTILDASGDLVARAHARWLVGPRPGS